MFLLDTNVVSELRRPERANAGVAAWASRMPPGDLYLSSITVLELETGALLLGRRDAISGKLISRWVDEQVLPAFAERILPVDTEVARRCATLHIPDPCSYRDSLIGATALVHRFTLVTRNENDFARMRVAVLNPWRR